MGQCVEMARHSHVSVALFRRQTWLSLVPGSGSNSIIGGLSSDCTSSSVQVSARRSSMSVNTSGTGLAQTSILASWKIPAFMGVQTQSSTQLWRPFVRS